jgi:hypothetical protein
MEYENNDKYPLFEISFLNHLNVSSYNAPVSNHKL